MDAYRHLSYEQRQKIKQLLDDGYSKSEIAKLLDVHNATVCREVKRGSVDGRYDPDHAESAYRQHLSDKGAAAKLFADTA